MAALVDVSTPARFTGTPNRNESFSSVSFTAPTNALLVVTLEFDGNGGGSAFVPTVTDSGGLSWTERVRRAHDETTAGGMSLIATARTTSATSRTVSINRTAAGDLAAIRGSAMCYVVTGVDVDGTPVDTVGANNEGGSTTNNITTTSITPGATGLLFAADTDWAQRGVMTSSDLTISTDDYAGEISVADGYKVCSSGVGVTANLNAGGGAAAQHKWCQIVVREAAGVATTRGTAFDSRGTAFNGGRTFTGILR